MGVFGLSASRVGSLHRAGAVERAIYSSDTRLQTEWPIHRLSSGWTLAVRYLVPTKLGRGISDSHDRLAARTVLLGNGGYAHAIAQTF